MRRSTLLSLLSLALVLALWAAPALAQAAPAPGASAPAVAIPVAPAPALAAPAAPLFALSSPSSGATCAATAPFAAPAIFCPYCPPGYSSCGYPFCRCCKGNL